MLAMKNGTRAATVLVAGVLVGCQANEPPPRPAPEPVVVEPEPAEPAVPSSIKVGILMPTSGTPDLAEYAVLIREGVDLALSEYESNPDAPAVELLVRDDAGNPLQAARAVETFESEGVVAVIGPLMSDALDAATASRRSANLVILSPTASQAPANVEHAYSLNATDSQGGAALARWAQASGMRRLAVMYAISDAEAASARAFTDAARSAGAQLVAEIPFDPGTTTFEAPVTRLVEAQPQAAYIAASARDLRQLVPQLAYYGLRGVQIVGGEAWIEPEVLRSLPAAALEGVVVATPLPIGSGDTGWADFVDLYQTTYRRTLDNPYPALGYDAARLILREIAQGRSDPEDLADALEDLSDYRGATGVLSIENGRISRRPFLVRIRSGRPEPLPFGGSP
jgi:branched-chain amino acid transport system substrate-binding protein